jgi:hypothetical protein
MRRSASDTQIGVVLSAAKDLLWAKASRSFAALRTTTVLLALYGCAASPPRTSATIDASSPRTVLMRGERLAESKRQIAAGDRSLAPAYDALLAKANEALTATPVSVIDKRRTPPSGDKHDYMSMAPYWWPDTTKPNGLPFIRRDGVVYPASRDDHDGTRFVQMIARVEALALAYYFTGDAKYSEGAARHVRVFFLDPATRMNPNLNYAQAVLGVNDGRGIGIIDTDKMPQLLDALRLLDGSPGFTSRDAEGMRAWTSAFLTWLVESKNGKDERAAKNNHGTFYDAQVAALALFVGDTALARKTIGESGKERIGSQIDAAGKQALELERTRPLHYSVFNVEAFTMLAEMGRHVNVDLWHYTAPSGGSIERALRFVAPYADATVTWPTPQERRESSDIFLLPLRRAAAALSDAGFTRDLRHVSVELRRTDFSRFSFPGMP